MKYGLKLKRTDLWVKSFYVHFGEITFTEEKSRAYNRTKEDMEGVMDVLSRKLKRKLQIKPLD